MLTCLVLITTTIRCQSSSERTRFGHFVFGVAVYKYEMNRDRSTTILRTVIWAAERLVVKLARMDLPAPPKLPD